VREVPQHLREGGVPNGGDVLRRSRYVRGGVAVHHAHRWEGFGDADVGVQSDQHQGLRVLVESGGEHCWG